MYSANIFENTIMENSLFGYVLEKEQTCSYISLVPDKKFEDSSTTIFLCESITSIDPHKKSFVKFGGSQKWSAFSDSQVSLEVLTATTPDLSVKGVVTQEAHSFCGTFGVITLSNEKLQNTSMSTTANLDSGITSNKVLFGPLEKVCERGRGRRLRSLRTGDEVRVSSTFSIKLFIIFAFRTQSYVVLFYIL
jgi:hypothetical protein